MHADDTNYAVIRNGIVVVSGTGPAIRVDGNRLVIRDGPQETPPLVLTRAQASRKLRHVVVCGQSGGYVSFEALRLLHDTGVAISQIGITGEVIFASAPAGPDRPRVRRVQALAVGDALGVAIASAILRCKVAGQARVAGLLDAGDTAAVLDRLAVEISGSRDGSQILSLEATAGAAYWKAWEEMPVNFARRNPERLRADGRWRPGRSDTWLTFGPRSSVLTGKPFRAATPAQSALNFLYGVLKSEMTIALLAQGLDAGLGLFHTDLDGRPSLALDAMEAVRPYVDCWLLGYLSSTALANRDVTELPDGEVRLTSPLNARLAHTAGLWRSACEPVANWLGQVFARRAGIGLARTAEKLMSMPRGRPPALLTGPLPPLPSPLPAFVGPKRGPIAIKDAPLGCWECGKGLHGRQRRFCSHDCATSYSLAVRRLYTVAATVSEESKKRRSEKTKRAFAARRAWDAENTKNRAALVRWYSTVLQPCIASLRPIEIAHALEVSPSYSIHVKQGRMPHPRHFPALAELVGIEPPRGLLPASAPEPQPEPAP